MKVEVINKLSLQQQRFCHEYLANGGHGENAAIAAGYSNKCARVQASKLLAMPQIDQYIRETKMTAAEKAGVDLVNLLKHLNYIATFDPAELYGIDGEVKHIRDLPYHVRCAIVSVEVEQSRYTTVEVDAKGDMDMVPNVGNTVKYKANDKIKAAQILMQHLGAFLLDNNQRRPIQIDNATITFE